MEVDSDSGSEIIDEVGGIFLWTRRRCRTLGIVESDSSETEIEEALDPPMSTFNSNTSLQAAQYSDNVTVNHFSDVAGTSGVNNPILHERNEDLSGHSSQSFNPVILLENVCQTTESSEKKCILTQKEKCRNSLDKSTDDDSQTCSICFEQWTNSSAHRLVSLKCGHLFGRSCIERWLKGQGSKCPQCNAPAKKSDIRTIFAKCLKVLDTAERDRALKELEKEAESRRRAELEAAQTRIKYQLAVQECERLKSELISIKDELQQLRSNRTVERNIQEFIQPSPVSFVLEKTLELCKDGGCRILAGSDLLGMLVVSHPSTNPLFPGCGLKKISTLDLKPSEFVCIHQKTIRDMAFHNHDALVLTASLDKTVKLTSVLSNSIVQTYPMNSDVWSCAWSKDDPCHFFAGLRNGSVLQFDTRMTSDHICELPNIGHCSPVVALQYLPKQSVQGVSKHGILVGQLSSCCFCEEKEDLSYTIHPLPLEGKFTSLSFEPGTGHLLASCRPSAKQPKVTHMLCELAFRNVAEQDDYMFSCDIVQLLHGGNTQVQISKSKLIPHPDNNKSVLVCAGDESSQSALIWDSSNGQCLHELKADSAVLDLFPFQTNHNFFLGTLTEKNLRLYRWQGE